MAFSLFGFKFVKDEDNQSSSITTFAPPAITDDLGVANIISPSSFQGYNSAFDINNNTNSDPSENALIMQYREVARNPEVDKAVEEIVSEAIIADERSDSVKIDLSETYLSEATKEKVRKAFEKTLTLLNFKQKGFDIFRIWYVDARLNYHVIIDAKNTKRGIVELRYIQPHKIKKIRELVKAKDSNEVSAVKFIEYFEYSDTGVDNKQGHQQGIRISPDAIVHVNSGLTNPKGTMIIGYLDKAIAPANKLRTLEHSMVIYRLVRAPERRLIYVDTGNLPRARAEQYMQSIVAKYKTKITYDTVSGKIKDDRNIMALTEDYFIPRQNGTKATEFTTLAGTNTSQGAVEELEFLKKQLYESLNVPVSRLNSDSIFSLGKSGEISRDEARFAKFISRIRVKFNDLFDSILSKELILTNVMSLEEWEEVKKDVHYDYLKDNYFTEMLEADALASRLGVLAQIEPYIGRFYSEEGVMKDILKLTDEQIKTTKEQIKKEKEADINAHTMSDTMHQVNLNSQLAAIEVDKHSQTSSIDAGYEADSNKPNPFKK